MEGNEGGMADNPFTKHPGDVGESYVEHFGKATGFGLVMIAGGLACLVHGFLPFLFERTGSETVRRLNGTLAKRVDKPNWERHPII
jgi:hypothetical protein